MAACTAGWNDPEGAPIALSCKKVSADYHVTRNDKGPGFKGMSIPVLPPEDLLEHLEAEYGVTYETVDL